MNLSGEKTDSSRRLSDAPADAFRVIGLSGAQFRVEIATVS